MASACVKMLAGEGFDPGEMLKLESVRIPRVVSMVTVLPGSNEAPLENLPETVKTVSAKVAGAAAATKRTARAIPMSQVRCGTKYVRPFAFEECCTARVWLANMWCLRRAVGSNTMPASSAHGAGQTRRVEGKRLSILSPR